MYPDFLLLVLSVIAVLVDVGAGPCIESLRGRPRAHPLYSFFVLYNANYYLYSFNRFFEERILQVLRVYIRFVDGLNERVGRVVSWLTAVLVAVVCYDVFTRYLLKNSLVAVQELEWHLFGLIFLLGAAYSLKHDQHVRVDVFYSRFSARKKAWVNLIGSVLFLIPFCIIVIVSSQYFVVSAFHIGETSPDPGGLPARWVLKAAIPLGFVLLLLQGLGLACRSLLAIRDEEVGG